MLQTGADLSELPGVGGRLATLLGDEASLGLMAMLLNC